MPTPRPAFIAALLLTAGCKTVVVNFPTQQIPPTAEIRLEKGVYKLLRSVTYTDNGGYFYYDGCNTSTCDKNGVCYTTALYCGTGSWSEK